MFTNPFNKKYQTGGSAPTDEQKQDMQGFVTWIKSNIDGFKDKSEQEIAKSLSDMAKSEEGKKSVQDLYTRYQKSKKQKQSKFEDGGKFQDFICKHARGGSVNCGCGGGKVIRGEDGLPDINPNSRESRQARRRAKKASDLNGVTRRNTSYIETPEGKWGFEEGDVNGNTTETYFFAPNGSVPTQVDTPWVQKIYTPYGYRIVNGNQNSPEWSTLGPRIEDILRENNNGSIKQVRVAPQVSIFPGLTSSGEVTNSLEDGGILKGQQGLSRAAGYYQRHANEGIIRKLQNFLMGRGYYNGDLDGKFGNQTYEAIRRYQRDNGLVDDGMWGEDTNEVHRVLGAGETTFNGPRSGAHPGRHTYGDNFVNRSYQTASKVGYGDINKAIERAISNPEWFMGDTEDAKNWRMLFMKQNPDGSRIFDQIYDSDPEFFGQSRFSKKLPTDLAKEGYINEINTARNNAGRTIIPVIASPIALANPVATLGAIGGGIVGASLGRNVGSDMKRAVLDNNGNLVGYQGTNSRNVGSHTNISTPSITPDRSNDGEIIGGTIGAIAGSAVPGVIESLGGISVDPRYNPTGVEMRIKEPVLKEIKPKKDWRIIKPKGGGNKRPGAAQNTLGKSGGQWFRRLTGEPIKDSEISGYILERHGGRINKVSKKACGNKIKK